MDDLIGAYLRHLRAGGYSATTIEDRRKLLTRLDQDPSRFPEGLAAACTDELEAFLAGYAGWSAYTYFTTLHGVFSWWVRTHRLDWDPTAEMRRPPIPLTDPHPWTEEELSRALTLRRPYRTAALLSGAQGLRCAEIAGLDREHVTQEWLRVTRKGRRQQELPTHEQVWAEIRAMPPGPVVRNPVTGGRYRAKQLSGAMSAQLAQLGLSVTLHGGRHRFASRALLPRDQGGAGADIRTVQELLGHRNVASTQRYTAVTDRQRRDAITALPVPASNPQEAA